MCNLVYIVFYQNGKISFSKKFRMLNSVRKSPTSWLMAQTTTRGSCYKFFLENKICQLLHCGYHSSCIHMANHHVAHFKYVQFYLSIIPQYSCEEEKMMDYTGHLCSQRTWWGLGAGGKTEKQMKFQRHSGSPHERMIKSITKQPSSKEKFHLKKGCVCSTCHLRTVR